MQSRWSTEDLTVVRAVVSLKQNVDDALTRHWVNGTALPKNFKKPTPPPGQKRAAVSPDRFIYAVLPFSRVTFFEDSPLEFVDPTCVVSGTYDDYAMLAPAQAIAKMQNLNTMTRRKVGVRTRYAQIGSLPLYIAIEGKNRVELFRKYRKPILAEVSRIQYPDHEIEMSALEIHEVWPFGRKALSMPKSDRTLADYDWSDHDRFYAVLPFPDTIIPLLVRFGVRAGRSILRVDAWKHQNERIRRATSDIMTS